MHPRLQLLIVGSSAYSKLVWSHKGNKVATNGSGKLQTNFQTGLKFLELKLFSPLDAEKCLSLVVADDGFFFRVPLDDTVESGGDDA